MEDPIMTLKKGGYISVASLFESHPYSYLFDGQFGDLDYIFVKNTLSRRVVGAHPWHVNSDEVDMIDYNTDYGRDKTIFNGTEPWRYSDHDPIVMTINIPNPRPTNSPSNKPSIKPTKRPVASLTQSPSVKKAPTTVPTVQITEQPVAKVTSRPSVKPVVNATSSPVAKFGSPSSRPFVRPSATPSVIATKSPSPQSAPTVVPTVKISARPAAKVTSQPAVKPGMFIYGMDAFTGNLCCTNIY
jgi:hypothetical protein